ncbi:MAG: nucleotidyltransferase family protein [Clostridia bacterium]|nr:nucleotidyltransferase family protein [Clostridia bacterium]
MDNTKLTLIKLIKSGLTGENLGPIDIADFDELVNIAAAHQILMTLYYGVLNSKVDIPEDRFLSLKNASLKLLFIGKNQLFELNRIFDALGAENIPFVPLKGTVLKDLYPTPEMRHMTDADIFIRTEQLDKIASVMEKLGYEYKYDSDHETVYSLSDKLAVEFHKRLIPSYNNDFYKYYENYWDRLDPQNPILSDEDQFIYCLAHLAKHYRDGGAGIKYLIDIYVILKKQNINLDYVFDELRKLQLDTFAKNIFKTVNVWFEGEESDEITELITEKVFSSGAYGKKSDKTIAAAYKKTATQNENRNTLRFKKLLIFFFPPFSAMAEKYPFLKKIPILLPLTWILRFIKVLFNGRIKYLKPSVKSFKISTAENISEYERELRAVGLDFNF